MNSHARLQIAEALLREACGKIPYMRNCMEPTVARIEAFLAGGRSEDQHCHPREAPAVGEPSTATSPIWMNQVNDSDPFADLVIPDDLDEIARKCFEDPEYQRKLDERLKSYRININWQTLLARWG
jgi:hypothetical protein